MAMIRRTVFTICIGLMTGGVLLSAPAEGGWPGDPAKCKPDAVKAGSVCMDKFEASVWQVPANKTKLITKIQDGTATLSDLMKGGATQISPSSNCTPPFPGTFPVNGQWTQPLYAVSIPGIHPTACVSWFQAQQACGNARKRLPTNAEWQLAASGSPEQTSDNGTTDCDTGPLADVVNTGSRSSCVSSWGAFDMVGNVDEWVADWTPELTGCQGCGPFNALRRGGNFFFNGGSDGGSAGPLTVAEDLPLSAGFEESGFRCAR
jgi:hypothetical protein